MLPFTQFHSDATTALQVRRAGIIPVLLQKIKLDVPRSEALAQGHAAFRVKGRLDLPSFFILSVVAVMSFHLVLPVCCVYGKIGKLRHLISLSNKHWRKTIREPPIRKQVGVT